MNKKSIITALLALITMAGWAQSTKTATARSERRNVGVCRYWL